MMFRMQSAWSSFPRIRWWGVQWMVGRIPEVPTRVLEGLQEGGVAEQALEAALEDLGVLERARAQEVLQELGRGVVAEEAEVKALRVVEQLAHLLLIARAHARGHCATMRVFQCSFSRLLSRLQQISCPQLPCKYCGTRCPHPFRNRAFHTRWCASRLQERCAARARTYGAHAAASNHPRQQVLLAQRLHHALHDKVHTVRESTQMYQASKPGGCAGTSRS